MNTQKLLTPVENQHLDEDPGADPGFRGGVAGGDLDLVRRPPAEVSKIPQFQNFSVKKCKQHGAL